MLYFWLALFFVFLQSFFSGMETGLVSLRKSRVAYGVSEGVWGAKVLMFFVERPATLLSTTLVGTNICVVCAASMSGKAARAFGFGGPWGIGVATVLLTLVLLSAEIIPKDWFRQDPYGRCLMFAFPLAVSYVVLYVPVRLMSGVTALLTRVFSGGREGGGAAVLLREDFRILIRESEGGGQLDSESADLLDRSLDFHCLRAVDLMTPTSDVVEACSDATVAEVVAVCAERGVSRVPVRGSASGRGDWRGVFSVYDVIFELPERRWGSERARDYLRALPSVSEDEGMRGVLSVAKTTGSPILAVSADGSGAVGLVTVGDVAKALFEGDGKGEG